MSLSIHLVIGANIIRSTKTWSPISSVFSMELDGISKACSAKVMMNRPVTITMAIEAINSGVVSLGLVGFSGSAGFRDSAVLSAFCAVFTEFLVVAKGVLPRFVGLNYCTVRNIRRQRKLSTRLVTLCAKLKSLSDGSSLTMSGVVRSIEK